MKHLNKNLSKKFITSSKVLYFSFILFILKINGKLNITIKRNWYSLFLIEILESNARLPDLPEPRQNPRPYHSSKNVPHIIIVALHSYSRPLFSAASPFFSKLLIFLSKAKYGFGVATGITVCREF